VLVSRDAGRRRAPALRQQVSLDTSHEEERPCPGGFFINVFIFVSPSRVSVLDGFFNLAQLQLISQTSELKDQDIYPHRLSKSFNPLLTVQS
jgi:hypothetical protein